MKTQTKYEEIFLNEIRTIPMSVLPQALKMLRSLKEGVLSVSRHQTVADTPKTGFCGAWRDDRKADEIVSDTATHRSGFGGNKRGKMAICLVSRADPSCSPSLKPKPSCFICRSHDGVHRSIVSNYSRYFAL